MHWVLKKEEDQIGTVGFGLLLMLGVIPCYLGDAHTNQLNPQKDPNWGMTMLGAAIALVGLIFALYKIRAIMASRHWTRAEMAVEPEHVSPGSQSAIYLRVTPRKTIQVDRIEAKLFCTYLESRHGVGEIEDGGTSHDEMLLLSDAVTLQAGQEYVFHAKTKLPHNAMVSDGKTGTHRRTAIWRYQVVVAIGGNFYWRQAQPFTVV